MPMPPRRNAPPIDAGLRDHLEDALDHWFTGRRGWLPVIDLIRRTSELIVRMDVPGVKFDDLRIEIDAATLTISGDRHKPDAGEDASYLRDERRFGAFSRSLALPAGIEPTTIDTGLEDGVLEVTLPLRPGSDTEPTQIRPGQ